MKVFRELYISAGAELMAQLVRLTEANLIDDWKRDKDAEARVNRFPSSKPGASSVIYCFSCLKKKGRKSALLSLIQKDPKTFYVSNIVPMDEDQLTRDEYNSILVDFHENVFKPAGEKAGIKSELTESEAELEQWMDDESSNLLRSFSSLGNKGAGASHPNDRERWNAFVLSAHRNGSKLDPTTLACWLIEVGGWPHEVAEQLALEYESGRELLKYAGAH